MPLRFLAFAALLFALLGCETSREQQLVGTWAADPLKSSIPVKGFERQISSAMSMITLKLRSDGTFVLVAGRPYEGKWKLDGNDVVFSADRRQFRATVGSDNRSMNLGQDTPLGEVQIALKKTG